MKTNGGFLVTKIKQLGDRIFEKILSEKNIDAFNGAQGRILYVLWQEDGISIRSLSTKCGLAITSLTTMLERMENQGLISRVQSKTDKRKTLLFLTEKAHALKGEYDSVSDEMGSIYYKEVHVKNRVYYEYYHLDGTQEVPADYKEISFVCLRPDGSLELPSTLGIVCRSVSKKLEGFEDFHFHQLRHTYTSNLLANGAAPKDVQELLGHSDVSTTMNVYAHSTRDAKRKSVRLLDKVVGND